MNKNEIEKIFCYSNNSDELFDAFQIALTNGIDDIELYKILIGNPTLTEDEILMYTEKLCSEFPENKFEIYLWSAEIFETKTFKIECVEQAFYFYKKAAQLNPENYLSFAKAMELYNYELKLNLNNAIIDFVEKGVDSATKKSRLYEVLVKHWRKIGDEVLYKKYLKLFEKAKAEETD